MLRAIVVCTLVLASRAIIIVNPGPQYPPTKGEIWPKPQIEHKLVSYLTLHPGNFHITVTGERCAILARAVQRYTSIIADMQKLVSRSALTSRRQVAVDRGQAARGELGPLRTLSVLLLHPCEEYPHLDMVESYNLTVANQATIISRSVWGILRGLESFSQLLYLPDDYSELRLNQTSVYDAPRYAHRGLMLDTSRHFVSLANILELLDGMAYNKMNVFHWHIVDDQSFPYQSSRFPDLSARGAYHERAVYTPQDVALVIKRARDRGIRVIPEFDVPGHTRSWGVAYPTLLTECYEGESFEGLGPMNPILNQTYKFLRELFTEIKTVFPDKYLHIGGDEVDLECWQLNPEIRRYMRIHNMSYPSELHSLFMLNVLPQLPADTRPIVWQEVVDEGVKLPNGSLVQIWKTSSPWNILKILGAGYRVLYSTCWYLDHLGNGGDWRKYYECDPREAVAGHDDALAQRIIGGEACMWSEVVDDNNVVSRVWPRTSAVAERLWSAKESERGVREVSRRLEEHTCRMMRRGVRAQPPSGPGFCLTV